MKEVVFSCPNCGTVIDSDSDFLTEKGNELPFDKKDPDLVLDQMDIDGDYLYCPGCGDGLLPTELTIKDA